MEKKIKMAEGSCPTCVDVLALSGRALPKSEADVICPSCLAVTENKSMTISDRLRIFLETPVRLKRGG